MAKPEMSPYLRFLGYDWYEVSAESVAEKLREVLEQAEEIWRLNVYASNDGVYITYRVRFPEEELEIQIKDIPSLGDKKRVKRVAYLKHLS